MTTGPVFHDPLIVQSIPPNVWKLERPFSYTTAVLGPPIKFTVPTGFIYDLASIPRIFRSVIPQVGKHREAATLHDYLYNRKGKLDDFVFTRKEADKVFLEAMKLSGVRFTRRRVMYAAVRLGGWTYWNKE